jgi:hypothetical protein
MLISSQAFLEFARANCDPAILSIILTAFVMSVPLDKRVPEPVIENPNILATPKVIPVDAVPDDDDDGFTLVIRRHQKSRSSRRNIPPEKTPFPLKVSVSFIQRGRTYFIREDPACDYY